MDELGLQPTRGSISGELIGYAYTANSIDRETQTRSSSETSFLRLALEKTTNLNVYKSTLAKKILFNGSRATGVAVDTAGVQYVLSAAKEVIVSAGAVSLHYILRYGFSYMSQLRSPQILMVSGVGPKEKLESLAIPVVADRPGVGQNMQVSCPRILISNFLLIHLKDHVLFGASYEVSLETHSRIADPLYAVAQVGAYLTNRTGALTNTGTELLGWEKLPQKYHAKLSNETQRELDKLPKDWPDLELIFPDGYGGDFQEFGAAPQDGKNYASVGVGLQSLFSRGNVTIKSPDSADHPIINPNLLGDPRDVDLAVQAVHRIREIAATKALNKVIIGKESYPGETVRSDADIKAWLQKAANTIYHASSTNKMGRADDKLAVVDSEAKVIGVQGLRVVDASAFPFLPPGHPQSLVYALAEKIAEAIQN
jgi:choline dehydrogenase-like flavoprotein